MKRRLSNLAALLSLLLAGLPTGWLWNRLKRKRLMHRRGFAIEARQGAHQ